MIYLLRHALIEIKCASKKAKSTMHQYFIKNEFLMLIPRECQTPVSEIHVKNILTHRPSKLTDYKRITAMITNVWCVNVMPLNPLAVNRKTRWIISPI